MKRWTKSGTRQKIGAKQDTYLAYRLVIIPENQQLLYSGVIIEMLSPMKRIIQLGVLCFLNIYIFGQSTKLDNKNYLKDIKTVILQKNSDLYDPVPIMELGASNALRISFDILSPNNEFFNYSFVHCDKNWKPSDLQYMDYVSGDMMGEITDFVFSTNTYQKYTHYSLVFPQPTMAITKSGNYILKVFRNFDDEDLVLTRRFMVLDNQTNITVDLRSATLPEYRFTHQEIDFEVNHEGFQIPNPFTELSATILQNNSWNNAIYNLPPLFVNSNKLVFNYEDKNLFPGTNEFRFFDIRSLRFFSNNVIKKYTDSIQNAVLRPEEPRYALKHLNWLDYNGKRVIANSDGVNIVEDGDYAMIHFYFKSKSLDQLGDVYVYGELTDWQLKDNFKMTYFPDYDMYGLSTLLKQSYYNYHFVLKDKTGNIDYTLTEGNFQETENDYMILIYHKNQFYGYDELIGMVSRNSNVLNNR